MKTQGGKGGSGMGYAPQPVSGGAAYGVNPFQQSSQGMQQAYNTVNQALGQSQGLAQNGFGTYSAAVQGAPGYQSGVGYDAARMGSPGVIAQGMGRYMNPYTNQVIGGAAKDMRTALQQELQGIGARADSMGAFGGSRQGLLEGQAISDTADNIGQMSSQMRHQGYQTAASLAGQDISNRMAVNSANQNAINSARQYGASQEQNAGFQNIENQMRANSMNQSAINDASRFNAQQGFNNYNQYFDNAMRAAGVLGNLGQASFGMGNQTLNNQSQSGAMSQAMQQALMDRGQAMFQEYATQPEQILQMRLASLGVNPLNNATTTTTSTNPGMGAMFGNLLGAFGTMGGFSPVSI